SGGLRFKSGHRYHPSQQHQPVPRRTAPMADMTVEPRTSRGLRDLVPAEMLARQWMIDTIRGVYELYGFVPIVTPAIEYLDVLRGSSAGAEAQQSIFTAQSPAKERLGLRFDLTVRLA